MQKNVASQKWTVFAFDRTDNTAKTGDAGNITADLYGDGSINAVDDTNPTEKAHGYYEFDITQAESNYDHILIDPVSATGDVQVIGVPGVEWTTPPNFEALAIDVNGKIDGIDRNMALIESQRGFHTVQGQVFYVDPDNGDTHANGNRGGKLDPYDSVQDCHDNAVTDSEHDCIILVAGGAAGVTTLTEDVTLSKRYLMIRGPGRDFVWTRSGAGDTIAITADGIELSGFQLETAGTGAGHGIQVTDADFHRIHHVWINNTQGDGINLLRANNCQIHHNTFIESGQTGAGEGIHILGTAGSSNNNVIENNIFIDVQGDGIKIEAGSTLKTIIRDNQIEGSTAWGINVGASSTDAFVTDNRLGNNTDGDIQDNGTTTVLYNNADYDEDLDSLIANLVTATGEPAQGAPPVSASLQLKIDYIYKFLRNKRTNDGTNIKIFADDEAQVDHKNTVGEAAGTYTHGEFKTGV